MNPAAVGLIVLAVLGAVVLSIVWSKVNHNDAVTDLRRSNARVVNELKAISRHRPTHIVDIDGSRDHHDTFPERNTHEHHR